MKKHLIAAAALATLSTAAFAQSVTVYGFIDAGLYTTNNGTAGETQTKATSGMWFPSMIGLTGSEDLGGGLKSTFNLQGSLTNQTGATGDATTSSGTSLFGRYATVGLSGSFGSINLGRQIDNLFLQSFVNGVIATHTNSLAVNGLLLAGKTNTNQSTAGAFWNNAVEYATPSLNGLQAKVQYLVSGTAGSSDTNSAQNILVTYSGPVSLSAGYETSKDGVSTGHDAKKSLLGAKYSVGAVDFAAQYNGFKNDGSAKVNGYEVGAAYHVSPKLLVGVNYEKFKTTNLSDKNVASLKAKYDFSKRTYAYGLVSSMNASAAAAIYQGYATTLGTAKTATGFGAGVVHSF